MVKTVIITRDNHSDDIKIRDPLRGKTIEKLGSMYAQLLDGRIYCYTSGSLCTMHKRKFKSLFGFMPRKGSKHKLFIDAKRVNW